MVKIRLTRTGRKNHASYRLVAIDSRQARDSKAIEFLGVYLPHTKEITLESDRIKYWLSVGAQPSDTVTRLLVKEGLLGKESLPTKVYANKAGSKLQDRRAKAEEKATAKEEKPAAEEAATEEEVTVEAVEETAADAE